MTIPKCGYQYTQMWIWLYPNVDKCGYSNVDIPKCGYQFSAQSDNIEIHQGQLVSMFLHFGQPPWYQAKIHVKMYIFKTTN